ncbi:MAG: FG-GAP-like repeat-containing protein [Verrucomicrobiia bacterium]
MNTTQTSCTGSFLATILIAALSTAAYAADQFTRVTNPGWTNTSQYSWGGVWGDYDGDGFIDLFVPNTTADGTAWTNFLYRNNGDGTFTRQLADKVGSVASDKDVNLTAHWADLNNDGRLDLLVPGLAGRLVNGSIRQGPAVPNRVFLNQGDGTFQSADAGDLTRPASLGSWNAVADYDLDGWLDFFACGAKWEEFDQRQPNLLYHGRKDGTFELVADSAIATDESTLSVDGAWGDYDNDGLPDLIVSNGYDGADFLYHNDGNGRFSRRTESIVEAPENVSIHVTWGDYDNDGFLDLASGTMEGTRLFRNSGSGDFVVVTNWPTGYPSKGWWADFDNDGYLDLLLGGGQNIPGRLELYRNDGDGGFAEVQDVFTRTSGYWIGGGWGDYDNDGFMDLFLPQTTGQNRLYHNLGNTNHWIKFRLQGTRSNRSAIGAKVRVRATIGGNTFWQLREVTSDQWASDGLRPNFGLGNAANVQVVRIEWPSGIVQELRNLSSNQIVDITEPLDLFVQVTNPGWTNSSQYSVTSAWGDYDGDGFIDLVVANCTPNWGTSTNFLYRNNGNGTFARQTADQVGPMATDRSSFTGVCWGDVNNDGRLDLLSLSTVLGGPGATPSASPVAPRLYLNQGNGRLQATDAGDLSKKYYGGWWGGLADYDNDGNLDAFLLAASSDLGHRTNLLFHGNGDGTFGLVTNSVIATDRPTYSNDAAWGDFDGDGLPDLLVSVHFAHDLFYHNTGHGLFTRVTNSILERYASTHSAWADFDNDGLLDVATDGLSGFRLWRNSGDGKFLMVTNWPASLAADPVWGDYDNDGYLDFIGIRGQGSAAQLLLFYNNGDGTFRQAQDAVTRVSGEWLGGGWGDYDNDGFLDMFVAENTGKNALYHNLGNGNHWIKFLLEGTRSNRSAIGAKVRVQATIGGKTFWQLREVTGGNFCQSDLRPNFGLGDAAKADLVRIEWPSGAVQELTGLFANQLLTVWEPPALKAAIEPGGACLLTGIAEPNRRCRIQMSADLKAWQELGTISSGNGSFAYNDTTAPGAPTRFYRVVIE